MKVGKEEMAGLVTAVERFIAHDFDAECARWERQVEHCLTMLERTEGPNARRVFPGTDSVFPADVPRVYLEWSPQLSTLARKRFSGHCSPTSYP
jgi:hypothetical protein